MARILVAGGSLGGLMAANLLLRAGHEVQVLERSARSLQGRGAGIVTHQGLREILRHCGVPVDDRLGVAVDQRVVLGPDGKTLCTWQHPQVLTSWGRLYTLLREALPPQHHRLGAAVVGVSQDAAGVDVQLAGGDTLRADLLVAADGIRSTVRGLWLPEVQPRYAGYVAWRGLCDEAALSNHTRSTLFPYFGFGLPEAEQMIGYPVAGADERTEPGQRRWNFVWYRPAAAGTELDALLTDADGLHHPEGIAPQQVSWRHLAAVRQAACSLLAPQFAEVLEKTAVPFLQPIFDLDSPQIALGRIALLGDAAFVARPHVGMGVAKAADDAQVLAQSLQLEPDIPAALSRYQALRMPRCRAVVQRARQLGAYLEAVQHGASVQRNAEDVMHQTAIDPALFDTPSPATLAT
jgi:2-polyprenyl-6-methoxyphenol hydroxylase-like FAD-dependent oxidoreductase